MPQQVEDIDPYPFTGTERNVADQIRNAEDVYKLLGVATNLGTEEAVEHVAFARYAVELAKVDFATYLLLFNPPDHTEYIFSKLHQFLADRVQGVVDGIYRKRQACSVSPQTGLSYITSILILSIAIY